MKNIFEQWVDLLAKNKIIPAEDKNLYVYGFYQGFIIILNIITTVIIGILFKMVVESIIFLIVYIPLRSYAGGYHAKTP